MGELDQLGRHREVMGVKGDVATLDFGRVNPVTGPFRVEGARPGDALVIDILDVSVGTWGWTACR